MTAFNATGGGPGAPAGLPACANAVDWFLRSGGGFEYRVVTAAALGAPLARVQVSEVADAAGDDARVPDDADLVALNAAASAPVPQCGSGAPAAAAAVGGARRVRRLAAGGALSSLTITAALVVAAGGSSAAAVAAVDAVNATALGAAFAGESVGVTGLSCSHCWQPEGGRLVQPVRVAVQAVWRGPLSQSTASLSDAAASTSTSALPTLPVRAHVVQPRLARAWAAPHCPRAASPSSSPRRP